LLLLPPRSERWEKVYLTYDSALYLRVLVQHMPQH
jgi:hypothetical protein